jgi:glycogen(starch) synthase
LTARSWLQPRCAQRADLVIGPSERFAALAAETFRLDPCVIRTLRHPVDISTFTPSDRVATRADFELLFVGSLSTRKGLELFLELSHRLDDLAGHVGLTIVGEGRWWSDYSPLLSRANLRVARAVGHLPPDEIIASMQSADALIVPSRFEPGSIVTGEALACGLPVIVSDEVGPSEVIDATCGRVFADGSAAALETATRDLLATLSRDRDAFRAAARARAIEHLSTDSIVDRLEALLADVVARGPRSGRA